MGDFFSSPQQRASQSLFDAARSGKPVGLDLLKSQYGSDLSNLRAETSNRLGSVSGDILSRAASQGISPGSSTEGLINKSQAPILAGEQGAEAGLFSAEQQATLNLILQQLFTGLQGLPTSSPAGDILGGLTTLGNLATGAGSLIQGLKWQPPNFNIGSNVTGKTTSAYPDQWSTVQ